MLRKHYLLKCYVNREEYDRIRQEAKQYGSISNYLRHTALERLTIIEEKLNALYCKLSKGDANGKR